jgi:very-short-patch-repair endonuclease
VTRELFPGGCRPPGKRSRPKPGQQEHEILMGYHLKELKLDYFREYGFHDRRRWKFDFAVPSQMLAIEIEGGAYPFYDAGTNTIKVGGHVRGDQYYDNCDKYNEAQIRGWDLLRFSVEQVKNGQAKAVIARWLRRGNLLPAET